MKTKIKNKLFPIMTAILLVSLMLIPSTIYASVDIDSVVQDEKCSLYIEYTETTEGSDPVVGAEFTMYKIADLGEEGEWIPIINGYSSFSTDTDTQAVLTATKQAYSQNPNIGYKYTAATNNLGSAVFTNVEQGLYIVEESAPAAKHFASIPFFASMPNTDDEGLTWKYSMTAYPKSLPAGDLKITKTVSGDAGDTTLDFHFVITLDNYTDTVSYVKSNGTKGLFKSGDTITLKHGETVTIVDIPVGTLYSVKEIEANANGYTTTVTGDSGGIMRTKVAEADFVNNKKSSVDTGDNNTAIIAFGICIISYIIGMALYLKYISLKKKDQN